jgi:outer membrane receptor for ferric coprogen and ferric-rhodotorulic acid
LRNSLRTRSICDIPGDTLSLALGGRIGTRFEAGLTCQQLVDREVILIRTGPISDAVLVTGTQDTHRLYGLFARYTASEHLHLRVSIDNLFNERDRLNDTFGGVGSPGPGRNVRLTNAAAF